MEKLSVKQQGVKGGNPTWKNDVGYITAIVGKKAILVDSFEGYGASYKRRETPQITITDDNENFTFNSIDELLEVVRNHFKNIK